MNYFERKFGLGCIFVYGISSHSMKILMSEMEDYKKNIGKETE